MRPQNNQSSGTLKALLIVVAVFLLAIYALSLGYNVTLDFVTWKFTFNNPTDSPPPTPNPPPPNPTTPLPEPQPLPLDSPITRNPIISSPERLLNSYTQSLTNRNFLELKEIYPKGNQEFQKQWLQDTSGKAPILSVQVVGRSKRINTSADGKEIVVRATIQYCRADGNGSTDIKNYTFLQIQEMWQLDSMTAAEKVTPIRC